MIADIRHHPPASHFTEVKGAAIHYLRWHQPNKATVLLVHGHAAHAHWWDAVAIHLRKDFDIIAVDLLAAAIATIESNMTTTLHA